VNMVGPTCQFASLLADHPRHASRTYYRAASSWLDSPADSSPLFLDVPKNSGMARGPLYRMLALPRDLRVSASVVSSLCLVVWSELIIECASRRSKSAMLAAPSLRQDASPLVIQCRLPNAMTLSSTRAVCCTKQDLTQRHSGNSALCGAIRTPSSAYHTLTLVPTLKAHELYRHVNNVKYGACLRRCHSQPWSHVAMIFSSAVL